MRDPLCCLSDVGHFTRLSSQRIVNGCYPFSEESNQGVTRVVGQAYCVENTVVTSI